MNYSQNNNLLIVGAGQYGLVALEIAQAMHRFGTIAFLDDSFSCHPGAEGDGIHAERHCEERSDEAILANMPASYVIAQVHDDIGLAMPVCKQPAAALALCVIPAGACPEPSRRMPESVCRSEGFTPTIIGTTRDIEKFAGEFHYGFVAIGNPKVRRRLTETLHYNCITPAILVHPQAYVSPSAQLQMGCCVEPHATVQTGAVVATATFIASGAVIKHDAFVGEYCHVDSNAVVESAAIVPAETKICCNSVFCKEQGPSLVVNDFGGMFALC